MLDSSAVMVYECPTDRCTGMAIRKPGATLRTDMYYADYDKNTFLESFYCDVCKKTYNRSWKWQSANQST